jgi:hypothetical protein
MPFSDVMPGEKRPNNSSGCREYHPENKAQRQESLADLPEQAWLRGELSSADDAVARDDPF